MKNYPLTERQLDNRATKLAALKAEISALESEVKRIELELKEDLAYKGVEEIVTPNWTIRHKQVTRNSLDTNLLKTQLPDVYTQFSKTSSYLRFSVDKTKAV